MFVEEIALYDRQIRLWGMATQLRLRSAKILLINLGAIGGEIIKNLVLGGLNSITILDDSKVKEEDFGAQFFLPNDESIVNQLKLPLVIEKIKELNNRVNLTIDTSSLTKVISDSQYLKQFDLIIATELDKSQLFELNSKTRELNIPLYATGGHGLNGYIITDLIKHTATSEKDVGNIPRKPDTKINRVKTITNVSYNETDKKEIITILDEYNPISEIFKSKQLPNQLNKRQMKRLSAALPLIFALFEIPKPINVEDDIDINLLKSTAISVCESFGIPSTIITEEYLNIFSKQAFTEFSPVAAIIGGTLAQDVIQFLSQKESPINNVLILDSIKSEMPIYSL
ncbi:uncharacterized protein RJT21DRAFT_440 [Scheffersomyces amazonensis]|uniref:uncharacterized protein n=1 Tax=Scheffersomyces amazonensis TaxID=1078765 RepID=UPI00315D7786